MLEFVPGRTQEDAPGVSGPSCGGAVDAATATSFSTTVRRIASSGTALLDRLETRGYISRTRPAENRRVVDVALTDTGRALGHAMRDPVVPGLARIAGQEPGAVQAAGVLRDVAEALRLLARETDGTRDTAG